MKHKVLFLIESFIVGGAERVLLNLVNAMDKERFDVTVMAVFKQSVYEGYNCQFADALDPSVHYHYLVDNSSKWKYRLFNVAFNRLPKKWIHRWMIGSGYDTEVAFYEGLPTLFLAHSSNKKSKKIAWLHYGNGFVNLSENDLHSFSSLYDKYDTVVGVSKGVSQNFKNKIGLSEKVFTLYNLIDEEEIIRKSKLFDVPRIESGVSFISVGRLCEVKGFDRLLHVCKSLKEEGYSFHLNIIGAGDNLSLEHIIRDDSMEGYVQLLGNQDNPMPYVRSADWFVCSSRAEAFGMAILESMLIGTPIISTECSGTEELLGENEYGIRCENSEKGLYNAMKHVLEHPDLRKIYSDKALQKGTSFHKKELLAKIETVL